MDIPRPLGYKTKIFFQLLNALVRKVSCIRNTRCLDHETVLVYYVIQNLHNKHDSSRFLEASKRPEQVSCLFD